MLITRNNVCHYLIAKGLVSNDSVVDGDFCVIDVSGRNRNFKILRGRHPGFFLKQIQNWDAQTIAMLQCETACYWLARNDGTFTALSALLPEFYWYDPERHILITELIDNSENLYEHFCRVGMFRPELAERLGTALGSYHSGSAVELKDSPHSTIFPKQVPWILLETRRNSHPFKNLSPATAELFEAVDNSAETRKALNELGNDWKTEVLIHGDMRLENCILSSNGKRGEVKLQIVDWELADIGDACWDVGAVIQAFLAASILSLPLRLQANFVRNGMRSAIGSFWQKYVMTRGVDESDSMALLERSVKYAAARMIQTVYEHVQFSPQVSPRSYYLFQISSEILQNPGAAIHQLIGTNKVKTQCSTSS